jgi:hypothetical protein
MVEEVTLENIDKYIEEKSSLFVPPSMKDAKETLLEIVYSNERGVYIIYGEQDIGKSRLINSIKEEIENDIFIISKPYQTERETLDELYRQLRGKQFAESVKLYEVKIRVNDAFKKVSHTIIIDNTSEFSKNVLIELLRFAIEAVDLKVLFVFSNNWRDLELDVTPKFEIKLHKMVEKDIGNYLDFLFLDTEFESELKEFKKHIHFIFETSKGNFTSMMALISGVFEIIGFAKKEELEKHQKVNECLIVMSAFHKELIDG